MPRFLDVNGDGSLLTPYNWNPLDVGSIVRLLADERDQVLSGSVYTNWGDQSAANNDLAQGASGPVSGGSINGWSAPRFNGTSSSMVITGATLSSIITNSAWFISVIVRPVATATAPTLGYLEDPVACDVGGYWYPITLSTSGFQCGIWDGVNRQTGRVAAVMGTAYRVRAQLSGGVLSMRVGSVDATPAAAGNVQVMTGLPAFGFRGVARLNAEVARYFICAGVPSAALISRLDQYDQAKYGVAI